MEKKFIKQENFYNQTPSYQCSFICVSLDYEKKTSTTKNKNKTFDMKCAKRFMNILA